MFNLLKEELKKGVKTGHILKWSEMCKCAKKVFLFLTKPCVENSTFFKIFFNDLYKSVF